MPFQNEQAAERAQERLQSLTGIHTQDFFENAFENNPAPDVALTNLERWLNATTSPSIYMQAIAGLPVGKLLLFLFGASQPLADTLIQNPELASLALEPSSIPTREGVIEEGKKLLASANSYSHSLDRLRFLRQKWNLLITLNDLSGAWEQPVVWKALSELADSLITLALDTAWKEFAIQRSLQGDCPLTIVAFGKLAGEELNYSSDVDLVYVLPDGVDEKTEKEAGKFAETLNRAISDRMGRGYLYRVDLRLRPYGAAGALVRSIKGFESYYELYAEPWEVQALLRSRPIAGPNEIQERWNAMRTRICFKPKLSELALEQMLSMRVRIGDHADGDDIKRGPGGIRDVEFLTQVFQLLHGHDCPELQELPTCQVLEALDHAGYLEHADATSLKEGYTFLRKLEHRAQLVNDQQTHSIPEKPEARESLAKLMECQNWQELASELQRQRRTISTLYQSILKLEPAQEAGRGHIQSALGPLGPAALQWFDVLPESEAFYQALAENEGSLNRLQEILLKAPRLVPFFKSSVALTELLLSGEIEEPVDFAQRITALKIDTKPKIVAQTYTSAYAAAIAQWILTGEGKLEKTLSDLADELIRHCCQRLLAPFDVLALGSLGTRDFAPNSDADLLLLVESKQLHREAEMQAQLLLAFISELKRLGTPIEIDLRLRPEGGKGLLVRTYEGLTAYDFEGMEMWERFALGHARQLQGNPEALRLVMHSAYGLPLTPERIKELAKMKRRIETERVKPQHVRRNVKLGYGGISDLEWLVHLHEMRYPTTLGAGETTDMQDRIRRLGRTGLINALEVELLLHARQHLLDLRNRLYLMGQSEDLVPENPERLDRLAHTLGF
ncbi:MAG: hypothetical protein ACAH95_02145, partial [Fimbriimonas sp.]